MVKQLDVATSSYGLVFLFWGPWVNRVDLETASEPGDKRPNPATTPCVAAGHSLRLGPSAWNRRLREAVCCSLERVLVLLVLGSDAFLEVAEHWHQGMDVVPAFA